MVWCGVVWCGVVWCGVVWCGVVWCGVVWCGVVWCGVAWRGVAWRGVVWCGVVWCGVVWCSVAWRGVVWCGFNKQSTNHIFLEVIIVLLFLLNSWSPLFLPVRPSKRGSLRVGGGGGSLNYHRGWWTLVQSR